MGIAAPAGVSPASPADVADREDLDIPAPGKATQHLRPGAVEKVSAALATAADETHRDAFAGWHGAVAPQHGGANETRQRDGRDCGQGPLLEEPAPAVARVKACFHGQAGGSRRDVKEEPAKRATVREPAFLLCGGGIAAGGTSGKPDGRFKRSVQSEDADFSEPKGQVKSSTKCTDPRDRSVIPNFRYSTHWSPRYPATKCSGMRQPRIKVPSSESGATYHCMSRTVNGEWLFDDTAKEVLRRQIWQVADYCGVGVVTYTIMANHFHVLLDVPQKAAVSDAELLRRYAILYPKPTKYQAARLAVIEAELSSNGPEAVIWRQRQLELMGDLSQYMKLVKQRFSIWFNKSHRRFGTLWAERFKSILVESEDRVLQTMAAYLDLNCVRAGLVDDPKDYRFCGYAEAVAGRAAARKGIQAVTGHHGWDDAHSHYREVLFGAGAGPREGAARLSTADLQRVIAEGGRLPLATILHCRLRYFTDGAVLGSRAFVEGQLARYRQKTGLRQRTSPRGLPAWTDWGDWATLRALRKRPFG